MPVLLQAWFGNDVRLSWAVSVVGGPRLDNGTSDVSHVAIAQGATAPIAAFGVKTPQVTEASKILVEVSLAVGADIVASNHWSLTVFPAVAPAKQCPVPVLVDADWLGAAQQVCANAAVAS